jgi:hypothetical protein
LKRVIRGQGDPGGGIAQFPEEERKTRFEPEADLMPCKFIYCHPVIMITTLLGSWVFSLRKV